MPFEKPFCLIGPASGAVGTGKTHTKENEKAKGRQEAAGDENQSLYPSVRTWWFTSKVLKELAEALWTIN